MTSRDGFWGAPTALNIFCEPKYSTSKYFAEFYNSLTSLVYVVGAAYVLSKREVRADALLAVAGLSIGVIGLGSMLFHQTMQYSMELLDEMPMMLYIALGCVSKCHAHPLLLTRRRCVGFGLACGLACGGACVAYAWLQYYEFFIASFTAFVLLDVSLACTWCSKQRPATWARNASVVLIVVGRITWETERHVCAADQRVWPLHCVWHFLSAASAYYGAFADMANRIDCGLGAAAGSRGATVPVRWLGVPFAEVSASAARRPAARRR